MADQIVVRRGEKFGTYFESQLARIVPVLAANQTPARLLANMRELFYRNRELQSCTDESLLNCCIHAAALRLPIGGELNQAAVLKFGNEATLVIGYRGFLSLLGRQRDGWSVQPQLVYDDEDFRVRGGTNLGIDHDPLYTPGSKRQLADPVERNAAVTHAYCVATQHGRLMRLDVMTRAEIDAIAAGAPGRQKGPWGRPRDWPRMVEKTVLLRVVRRLPIDYTGEWSHAMQLETAAEVHGADQWSHVAPPGEGVVEVESLPDAPPAAPALAGEESLLPKFLSQLDEIEDTDRLQKASAWLEGHSMDLTAGDLRDARDAVDAKRAALGAGDRLPF